MVLAAPLFLMAQTRAVRAFYVANRNGFMIMGGSLFLSLLSLRLLSKVHEVDKLQEGKQIEAQEKAAILATLTNKQEIASILDAKARRQGIILSAGQIDSLAGELSSAMQIRAYECVREERRRREQQEGSDSMSSISAGSAVSALAASAEKLRTSVAGERISSGGAPSVSAASLPSFPSPASPSAVSTAAAASAAGSPKETKRLPQQGLM